MADDKKSALHLTNDNFQKTLDEAGDMPILIDFYAEWCGPCKMAAPIIEDLAGEFDGKAVIAKLDVDAQGQIAAKYGVMSIPTVIVVVNGEEVDRQIGFAGRDGYVAMLERAIK